MGITSSSDIASSVVDKIQIVVDDIEQKSAAEYGAIAHEIIERPSIFSACNIVHEYRSSNFEAHNHVWLVHPGDLLFLHVRVYGYEFVMNPIETHA